MHTGTAHRSDIIVAGRDMFSVDVVGATLMGVSPSEVKHLAFFAQEHNRSLEIDDIEVKGLTVADHVRPLEIETPWVDNNRIPEVFVKQNVQGFDLPLPKVLCTGCSFVFPNVLMFILSANKGIPFGNYELLAGEAMVPSGKANKTFLMGDCPIKDHKNNPLIKEAIHIPGCPPSQEDVFDALSANGVQGSKTAIEGYFNHIVKRYEKAGFPREDFYLKPDDKK